MPPTISLAQLTGFGIFMIKAVLSGRGDEMDDLAKKKPLALGTWFHANASGSGLPVDFALPGRLADDTSRSRLNSGGTTHEVLVPGLHRGKEARGPVQARDGRPRR